MDDKSDRKELERRLAQAKRMAALLNDPVTTERGAAGGGLTPSAMLWVAVPCCSTAEEIDVVIPLMRSIVCPIALIAPTDSPVARCMLTMWR
jgi:hypothetical protein